jgi:hypothetical protein
MSIHIYMIYNNHSKSQTTGLHIIAYLWYILSRPHFSLAMHTWGLPFFMMYTTGIAFFAEYNTRQRTLSKYFIGKGFFAEYFFWHSAKNLPSVKKHSAKKNTRQIKNRKKLKTNKKIFLNFRNNSPTLPITLPFALSFWIKFICFVNDEIQTRNLSLAYPPIPLHYYTNYVYITFSFPMYYNKPRVIWLFNALNEFI